MTADWREWGEAVIGAALIVGGLWLLLSL